MDWLDVGIVIALIGAMWHGIALGLVRQVGSTIGLVGGLFLGAYIETKLSHIAHTPTTRAALALGVLWGCMGIVWSAGEWLGMLAKQHIQAWRVNRIDGALGALIGGITVLATVWLGVAALDGVLQNSVLQQQIHRSRVVATLNQSLPPAPNFVARIGHIINPNGFPQVFAGLEPTVSTDAPLPDLGELTAAVQADQHSVVKIEGRGCGGIVEGSGFVAKTGIVLTNAHVVAGVSRPQVVDVNGEYSATVVLFDPNLDLAVLRVDNLKDAPLPIDSNTAPNGTPAAVLGYPGGGDLHIGTARILQSLEAMGRNIYGQGTTTRLVYSVKATVRPGNSGGPLIAKNGNVIGIVFAESTVNDQTGYALAMHAVSAELAQGATRTLAVGTGACAE